ncbi:MAG: hypothetical protein K0R55_4576 [Sporomusa sp.]|nr:hypothetical protein [Sporomusa sp.]
MYLLTSFPEIVAADKSKKTFGISLIAFNSIITIENGLEKFQPIFFRSKSFLSQHRFYHAPCIDLKRLSWLL